MNNMYEVQQLLKKYGIFIYTGNRIGDLELMKIETSELYKAGIVTTEQFLDIQRILNKEINK